MAIFRNIVFRKLIASALLALLLVIHAVKFFHHHDTATKQQYGFFKTSHVVLTGNSFLKHCAICDFHVTGDADSIISGLIDHPLQVETDVYIYYSATYHSEHASLLRLRGPPAMVPFSC